MPLRILSSTIVLEGPLIFDQVWRLLWRPFLRDMGTDDPLRVAVREESWGFSLTSPGRDVNVTDPWRALIESRNDVIRLAVERQVGVIDLHAAVLERDGKALLLIGEAWSGKTTIALELVDLGWRYFSDDVALIETETRKVRPLPKPPGVKAHPWSSLSHHWGPEPLGLDPPTASFLIPPPFSGSLTDRAVPSWLVFLDHRPGAQVTLEEISPARAVTRAAEHLRGADNEAVALLSEICLACRSGKLTYGESRSASALLDRGPIFPPI